MLTPLSARAAGTRLKRLLDLGLFLAAQHPTTINFVAVRKDLNSVVRRAIVCIVLEVLVGLVILAGMFFLLTPIGVVAWGINLFLCLTSIDGNVIVIQTHRKFNKEVVDVGEQIAKEYAAKYAAAERVI